MSKENIIGLIMVSIFALVIFFSVASTMGLLKTLAILLGSVIGTVWILFGVDLMTRENN